jgi:predicted ATP-dependent protease
MHIAQLADVVREADYWANEAGRAIVKAEDVERAIQTARRRSDRISDRSREMVQRGLILIDTDGEKVRQVNGLSG